MWDFSEIALAQEPPCEKCEIQEARIQALHQNSADCMKMNAQLKAENMSLLNQQASLRERAGRNYAEPAEAGDLAEFYRLMEGISEQLRNATDHGSLKSCSEVEWRLRDLLEDFERYNV